jgi:hypothetical protein
LILALHYLIFVQLWSKGQLKVVNLFEFQEFSDQLDVRVFLFADDAREIQLRVIIYDIVLTPTDRCAFLRSIILDLD